MSKELGDKALQQVINTVLNRSNILAELRTNYRKDLNSKYHVLDLSYEALKSANLKSKAARKVAAFDRAYAQFIEAVKKHVGRQIYNTLDDITTISSKTFFVQSPPLLISPSFDASRANISVISKSIKNNIYFGISDRSRTLSELVSEGYTLEELESEGRIFDPKSGQELVKDQTTGKLIPRVRTLSVVDLGHTPGQELGRDSPLSEQLLQAASSTDALSISDFSGLTYLPDSPELDISTANENISALLLTKLYELSQVQAKATVSFKNEIPEKLASLTGGDAGFLTLTLQLYNVNNDISVKESAIRNSLLAEIKDEIRKVVLQLPGSDTMEQDLVNAVKQRIVEGITGKGSGVKLQGHSTLNTSINNNKKSGTQPGTDGGNLTIATGSGTAPPIRTLSGQFYSLASLQQLLNDNLQNVIAANMGDGTRKDVLNYRSGRFAGSVHVERLSQSREGMITAYYNYMKNPYQTFEPGYKQGKPTSRDPKLLIAKSIREIAETKVGNRMRAVSV